MNPGCSCQSRHVGDIDVRRSPRHERRARVGTFSFYAGIRSSCAAPRRAHPTARRIPCADIAVNASARNGCQLRMPTCTGSRTPRADRRASRALRLPPCQLRERRYATKPLIVMRDLLHPLGRNPSSAQNVGEKRPHVLGPLRPTKGHEQHGIEWLRHRIPS